MAMVFILLLVGRMSLCSDQWNVVFILSDNQSYYEMSCHGHAQIKTPNIDALARESVEFSNFHAPNFCSPSRAVILTGQYAMRNGVFNTIGGRSLLHRDATTLADVMKQHGYGTAIFGKWHLGFSYPYRPQDRGFDEVFVHGGGGVGQLEDYFGNSLFDTTFLHNGQVTPTRGYCTDVLFDRAMRYIETQAGQPFFCLVWTPVTHFPHQGPKELVAQLKADGFTGDLELMAQVHNLDSNIGRMKKHLDDLHLADNTILIYASDQGMSDRGAPHGTSRQGLAYDPAHHVPFFVRVPGVTPRVTDRLAGMIDFFPTILDLCGMESPVATDGMSLKPLLMGRDADYPAERTLILQCPRGRAAKKWVNAAVKTDRWRLTNGENLYDMRVDPRQQTDVADEHPQVVQKLQAAYEAFWADLPEQETTLSRHLLGADECPEVVLNGMDWYRGGAPWHSGAFKNRANGAWPVTILHDGNYIFECRHYPREANKPAKATRARLKIGQHAVQTTLGRDATHVRFEVPLEAGDYDLETFMSAEGEPPRGALFVYVSRK